MQRKLLINEVKKCREDIILRHFLIMSKTLKAFSFSFLAFFS